MRQTRKIREPFSHANVCVKRSCGMDGVVSIKTPSAELHLCPTAGGPAASEPTQTEADSA